MCLLHYRPIPQILCFYIPFPKRQLALLRMSSQISLCLPLPPYPKSTSTISLSTSNRSSLRADVLRHIRLPVQTLKPTASRAPSQWSLLRLFSSHDDHLTKEEVIDRVLDVVKSFPKVDPSKVTPDVHFQKDLGLDSLDNVEIVMALEEEFKLEIPDKEADKIDSCNLAIEYIYNHPMAG